MRKRLTNHFTVSVNRDPVSPATDASGQKTGEQRYKPGACPERQRGGEVRWTSGAGMPTDKQFTGQTRLTEGYVGTLYDYVARAYDPVLGRFIGAGNPARGHDCAGGGEWTGVQQIHVRQ